MNLSKCIWVLEDDLGCQFVFRETLGMRYSCRPLTTLAELKAALDNSPLPDLLVADLVLPDASFLQFWDSLQWEPFKKVPVLVVSSLDDLDLLRECFARGAADFLTKPFGRAELIAKAERIVEQGVRPWATKRKTPFLLNSVQRSVSRDELCSVSLSPKEYQILSLFEQSENFSISRTDLLTRVWSETHVTDKTVDVHLHNLRKKLRQINLDISSRVGGALQLVVEAF